MKPIQHSPRRKKMPPSRYVYDNSSRDLPAVMKRRCPVCNGMFQCRDVIREKCCPACVAAGVVQP